jgi:hypothetical protein
MNLEAKTSEEQFKLVSAIKLPEAIENYCFAAFKGKLYCMVANGPYISVLKVDDDETEPLLKLVTTIHAFQKPIMKVVYDGTRERLIASGLDQQMKFFEIIEDDQDENQLQLRL